MLVRTLQRRKRRSARERPVHTSRAAAAEASPASVCPARPSASPVCRKRTHLRACTPGDWSVKGTKATAAPDILFTIDDASEIRRTFKEQPGVLHTEARRHLNEITDIAGQDGADDVYYISDSIRWKEYIAMHAQWQDIIGNGIIATMWPRSPLSSVGTRSFSAEAARASPSGSCLYLYSV